MQSIDLVSLTPSEPIFVEAPKHNPVTLVTVTFCSGYCPLFLTRRRTVYGVFTSNFGHAPCTATPFVRIWNSHVTLIGTTATVLVSVAVTVVLPPVEF